jgi:hypothetical protein
MSSKKITYKGTLRQATICLIPLPLPLRTEYGTNMYLFAQGRGRGGGEFNQKFRGATVQKAGLKIPSWLDVSPVYKLW